MIILNEFVPMSMAAKSDEEQEEEEEEAIGFLVLRQKLVTWGTIIGS